MNVEPDHSIMNPPILKLEDLRQDSLIHFSGIGGSAMNGLALMLSQKGYRIQGTDPAIEAQTKKRLENNGITVFSRQDGSKIDGTIQLVVTTAALAANHPELQAARVCNVPIVKYAAMLGVVMNSSRGIAVAGTHGKTTTTSLLVAGLRGAEFDPGYVIGGFVPAFGDGAHGGKDIFIAEACEYDRSFLNLHPHVAVVTNIEADHLDVYSGVEEIVETFAMFAQNLPPDGVLVYCKESPAAVQLAKLCDRKTISYGFCDADFFAENINSTQEATSFDIVYRNERVGHVSIQLPGKHNVLNALGAFCVSHQLGACSVGFIKGLEEFSGVKRRFEQIGQLHGVTIIDDYAHHPTEIQALLEGAKERYPSHRIYVAFQPHQISRTKFFFDEFAASFSLANYVFLPDIYVARDAHKPKEITSANLAKRIETTGTSAMYTGDFETTAREVFKRLRPGDLFLTVGAGNIFEVAHQVHLLLQDGDASSFCLK